MQSGSCKQQPPAQTCKLLTFVALASRAQLSRQLAIFCSQTAGWRPFVSPLLTQLLMRPLQMLRRAPQTRLSSSSAHHPLATRQVQLLLLIFTLPSDRQAMQLTSLLDSLDLRQGRQLREPCLRNRWPQASCLSVGQHPAARVPLKAAAASNRTRRLTRIRRPSSLVCPPCQQN
jgi:hypothetical protein